MYDPSCDSQGIFYLCKPSILHETHYSDCMYQAPARPAPAGNVVVYPNCDNHGKCYLCNTDYAQSPSNRACACSSSAPLVRGGES